MISIPEDGLGIFSLAEATNFLKAVKLNLVALLVISMCISTFVLTTATALTCCLCFCMSLQLMASQGDLTLCAEDTSGENTSGSEI
jgi:hypothetical protein